jgi:regulator of protease activity HflC (stomatin/prohibitin superfamily)
MPKEVIAALVLAALFILFLVPNIKIIRVNEAAVIERLGVFHKIIDQPGIHFLIPFFERIVQQEVLLPIDKVITTKIDGYEETYRYTYQINDIKLFCYGALDAHKAILNHITEGLSDNKEDVEDFKDVFEAYGVTLIKITKMN